MSSLVLAGYDGGRASTHALCYAAGLAARIDARLVVLNVAELPMLGVNESVPAGYPRELSATVDEVTAEVLRVVPNCGDYEIAVKVGDPATVIQEVADERHADMIVVGQARHRWMHPLGSVPSRLAHHARQPVLIVP